MSDLPAEYDVYKTDILPGVKPPRQALARERIRRLEMEHPTPAYKDNPHEWEHRMRARMAGLARWYIKNDWVIDNELIAPSLKSLAELGKMGDAIALTRIFWRRLRRRVKANIQHDQKKAGYYETGQFIVEQGESTLTRDIEWVQQMYVDLIDYAKEKGYDDWWQNRTDGSRTTLLHFLMSEYKSPLSTTLTHEAYTAKAKEKLDEHYNRPKQEPTVYNPSGEPLPDADAGLDVWFKRDSKSQEDNVNEIPDATNVPVTSIGDADATPPAANDWIEVPEKRNRFFAEVGKIYDFHNVPKDKREKFTTDTAGSKLHQYVGTASDLLKRIKQGLEAQYPVEEKMSQNAPKSAKNDKPAMTTPEAAQTTQTGRSSEPPQLSDIEMKKEEIRKRYNQPQRGKDYLMVSGRVLLFRLDHPDWSIQTESVMLTDVTAVFKATIANSDGVVIATGHGRATETSTKNLTGRYVEKAETSAIGRALALAGYSTDDTLDDADYLVDSPVAKAS